MIHDCIMIKTFPIALLFSLLIVISCDVFNSDEGLQIKTKVVPENSGSVEHNSGPNTKGGKVMITAMPSEGFEFYHWGEDTTDTENPKAIYMNKDKKVVAVFRKIPPPADIYPLELNRKWTYSYYYSDLDSPYENERNGHIIHEVIGVEESEEDIIYTILEVFDYDYVVYDQPNEPYESPDPNADTLSSYNHKSSEVFQITEKPDGKLISTGAETAISAAFDTSSHILTYGYDGTTSKIVKRFVPKKDLTDNRLIAYDNSWLYIARAYVFRADSGIVNIGYRDRDGLWLKISLEELE